MEGTHYIPLHFTVTVKGDSLKIDFPGSDARPEIQAYSSFGNTRGYVVAQLASMMDPTIPKNEGFFDSIELVVPTGCCLNPPEGRSVAAGTHHPGTEVGEAVAKALEQVVPERSCPQVYKMGMPTVIFGTNPRDGKMFIDHSVDTFAAYCGAVKGQDGWGGMNVSFGNLIRATAEINESIFPIRQLWRDYETDTGGAGEYRGNCGSLYRKQVLAPATTYTYVVGKRYPMPGIAGGKPGSPNQLVARAGGDARGPARLSRMRAPTEYLWFDTRARRELVNITDRIAEIVAAAKIAEGFCLVSAMHITAGIWVNDEESGLKQDLVEWLDKLAPPGDYRHHLTGEDNADAHLKRTLIHHQVILPVTTGKLDLGPWEQT